MLPTPDAAVGVAHIEPDSHRSPADGEPPPQQCGRCRLLFAGDPTLHPTAQPGWWLCPPCRVILLGRYPAPDNVAHRRQVGEP
jgi:hypothetical protein